VTDFRDLSLQGLWKNNPALVQLLGLCPLLAVTATFINGLGLGLATMLVLMIIAAFVTIVQLLMNAYTYDLYLALGIFIPLIVTNCAIIGRAEAFASKNGPLASAYDGFMMGLGFTAVLVILGGMREILGAGTLLAGADRLFGSIAENWTITLFNTENPFLLAILPPGAFLGMGLLIAIKNSIDAKLAAKQTSPAVKAERVRVTAES